MSVEAISWAFRVPLSSCADRIILVALANYADEWGVAWPGQSTLARLTCLSDRRVRSGLVDLETAGLIARAPRRRPDGTRRSDVIVLVGFDGRRRASRPDDHDVVDLVALDLAVAGRINRNVVPVDVPDAFSDQPERGSGCDGASTGTDCMTNRHHVPVASIYPDTKDEPKGDEDARGRARDDGDLSVSAGDGIGEFVRLICEALGDPSLIERHWWRVEADFGRRVASWRELGLDDEAILRVARRFGREMPQLPDGPKALDAAMRRAARDLRVSSAASRSTVSVPEGVRDGIDLLGQAIAAGRYVPPASVSPSAAREMLARGLVTEEQLRAAGIAA